MSHLRPPTAITDPKSKRREMCESSLPVTKMLSEFAALRDTMFMMSRNLRRYWNSAHKRPKEGD